MAWSIDDLERWFIGFHASDEAGARARAVARDKGLSDMADDLYIEWYLSIRTWLERLRQSGGDLPGWIDSEQTARPYVCRALVNDAIDMVRQRSRSALAFSSIGDDETPVTDVRDESTDVESTVLSTDANSSLEDMVRSLNVLLTEGRGGCPGCTALMTVQICLGVLERVRFPDRNGPVTEVSGGTTDWDKLVYEVLLTVAPDRVRRTPDNRMDDRTRTLKRRCGKCARELLGDLAVRHLVQGGAS